MEQWVDGPFNMLGERISRDDSHRVSDNVELIRAFNDHPYGGSFVHSLAPWVNVYLRGLAIA